MVNQEHRIDVVGDVHGQLAALTALGQHLGYDVDGEWDHPEGRVLVFLGDLVDRGQDSLGVCELVLRLVQERRAVCLMGNHEYNLVGHRLGLVPPKHSNRKTIAQIAARPERWNPVLDRLGELPLALDLPELRLIHAVWHHGCFDRVRPALAPSARGAITDTWSWLMAHVALGSPFEGHRLRRGLPEEFVPPGDDTPHEVLIKGYEENADEPFEDIDGKSRNRLRVTWWKKADAPVPQDKVTVFGHYWNLPPLAGAHDAFAPPDPSGHPRLRAWQGKNAAAIPPVGRTAVPAEVRAICVDYNGVFETGAGSCVGAYRWPEREVAWARMR